ncbi:ESAT-6-like protein 12 [Mycobacteroides abscessus subsp. bolletii]|uniref:WXG100 family type VII secretion target n=1 Tax=Mycobacteroides abscessus TaxID=36809 RepID=UPI000927449D|nr:WXG100 family type VII secretion target [Mycobacteroides abscessus]SHQ33989.1 ESAT-6-like protein 12 [Mycobacteroides abscessus subsp. bolletii]SHS08897.1 ESAT-6-like protein 12 [Mycobacteroides abscessus subsp. bolletii]SHS82188.1 ESAT-6-like protein 12 [Mycobacteroides abscessus subsp. bolletii]SHS85997.1 ESAT-6-like protein 12 [Mycobacteroides abscessus subsp. bolletii]SHX72506.1 ESAT-6-like protein 12 [Mycobacteroides abscessus subsp. bolletii]
MVGGGDDAYKVDLEALDDLITHMAQFTKATDSNVELIAGYVAKIPWQGATERAHKERQAQWDSGIKDLLEGLAKIREGAKTAHGNYTSAINANLKMWGH